MEQHGGIAALGMKSLGGTASAVKSGLAKAEEMLRYAMSLPVATTIAGIDSLDVLRQNLRVARGFKPLSAEEMQALRDRCAKEAGDGRHEPYKLSLQFDNPQARQSHGFPLDIKQKEVQELLLQWGCSAGPLVAIGAAVRGECGARNSPPPHPPLPRRNRHERSPRQGGLSRPRPPRFPADCRPGRRGPGPVRVPAPGRAAAPT